MDRERLTEELTALKASERRQTAPAVRLDKVFASDFETVYKALNASERRRLWRSVIKEIRMDAGKNLDGIKQRFPFGYSLLVALHDKLNPSENICVLSLKSY